MYEQKQQTAFASGKLQMEENQIVLAELLQIYPQTTLMVDAMDECDEKTRSDLIKVLNKFCEESTKPVKIFISSRHNRDIRYLLENGPNLEIRATDNREDIAMFVRNKLAASPKYWQEAIGVELKEQISKTLEDKSKGM